MDKDKFHKMQQKTKEFVNGERVVYSNKDKMALYGLTGVVTDSGDSSSVVTFDEPLINYNGQDRDFLDCSNFNLEKI